VLSARKPPPVPLSFWSALFPRSKPFVFLTTLHAPWHTSRSDPFLLATLAHHDPSCLPASAFSHSRGDTLSSVIPQAGLFSGVSTQPPPFALFFFFFFFVSSSLTGTWDVRPTRRRRFRSFPFCMSAACGINVSLFPFLFSLPPFFLDR